ncbi:MAG: tRNA lysidine(34) synthetase TilS, partial [Armatimonadota bacterium]
IDGLGSIRPVRGNIVRPLLDTPRRDIDAYVKENALPFRIDETNMDVAYSRNRIRHELLPLLESNYNPEIRAALVRLADIASDTSDFISLAVQKARSEIVSDDSIEAIALLKLPIAVQRQIVRMEIERVKGDLKDVSLEQVDRVIEALHVGGDFTITLPTGRIYAVRCGNEFAVRAKQLEETVKPFDIALNVPGITRIPQIGCVIEAKVVENPVARRLPPNEAMIDLAKIRGALRVRSLRDGDRIVPLGMSQSKKLQDIFVNKKTPKRDRSRAVLLVDDEKTLWVGGVVSSETGKIGVDAKKAVHLLMRCDDC